MVSRLMYVPPLRVTQLFALANDCLLHLYLRSCVCLLDRVKWHGANTMQYHPAHYGPLVSSHEFGPRLLFEAARDGDLSKMRHMLEHDKVGIADFHMIYPNGEVVSNTTLTAYLEACSRVATDAIDGVQLLVEHGADISITVSHDRTAMEIAILADMVDVVEYLLANRGARPAIHGCRSVEMMQLLMRHGVDVCGLDAHGRTILHDTVSRLTDTRAMQALALCHGVDIDAVSMYRGTALNCAAQSGDIRSVRHFCEAGARLDLRDSEGRTPIESARFWMHTPFNCGYRSAPSQTDKHATYNVLRNEPSRRHDHAEALHYMCAAVSDPSGLGMGSALGVLSLDEKEMVMRRLGYRPDMSRMFHERE